MNTRADIQTYLENGVITEREAYVLELRYIYGLSQWTIALAQGKSRSTIRDLERNALRKIARHQQRKETA